MNYKWVKRKNNLFLLDLYEEMGYPRLLANIMINRNLSISDYETITGNMWKLVWEYCDNIVGLNAAANKIIRAILNSKNGTVNDKYKIYIFSDYDTDGVTALGIITEFLYKMIDVFYYGKGNKDMIQFYVPNRSEGYGLNMNFCDKVIAEKENNPDLNYLVITFDNGITKVSEVRYLIKNDIDVVITDHHEPENEYPSCIVVDPKKDDERFGEELCGAGIAWVLCVQIYKILSERFGNKDNSFMPKLQSMKESFGDSLRKCLGYAAIGTVGDIMPMTLFNILLVHNGLQYLNDKKRKDKNPIDYLAEILDVKNITGKDIGFTIGAAINACGQMENIEAAVNLMVKSKTKEEMEAAAKEVKKLYDKNKEITKQAKNNLDEVIKDKYFDNNLFCIYKTDNIPNGIAGKLANHLTNSTGKPAIVFVGSDESEDIKGSGRCQNSTIDMLHLLKKCQKEDLIKFANGHKMACGVCAYPNKLKETQEFLDNQIQEMIESEEVSLSPENIIFIDEDIDVKDINFVNYSIINALPYANDFQAPVFCLNGLIKSVSISKSNPNNICYTIKDMNSNDTISIWVWNKKPNEYNKDIHKEISLVGTITRNFMAPSKLTLDVIDLKFN